MRITFSLALAIAALLGLSGMALAQGPPQGGPGGPGGGRPMNPVLRILDADEDGELSADEMEKAPAALKALDRNKDGKLTDDELRPMPPGGGPGGQGGPGGPGGRGPGGAPGEQGGPGGPALSLADVIDRYLSLDANKDGKLTKDEVPERMQGIFARADADKDESITKEELTKMAEQQTKVVPRGGPGGAGGGGFGGGGRGPGGPGGFGGNGGFGAGGGGFGAGGGFGGNRGNGGFGGGAAGGGAGRGGPPSPQAFMERAMEFDADKDGKLSKDELAKLAEQMGSGRGGPGGPPREGRGPVQPPAPQ